MKRSQAKVNYIYKDAPLGFPSPAPSLSLTRIGLAWGNLGKDYIIPMPFPFGLNEAERSEEIADRSPPRLNRHSL